MKTVLVYALSSRTSGGYSVVENLYYDLKRHEDQYPQIRWVFIVGRKGLESTSNIKIINDSWAVKSWVNRLFYERKKLKKTIIDEKVDVVVSINMIFFGNALPYVISFHNALPLYSCSLKEFDNYKWIIRQKIVNYVIKKSLLKADAILVPSKWIKKKLTKELGISNKRIHLTQVPVPEMRYYKNDDIDVNQNKVSTFIFPATGFPYKNHRTIVEACKILKKEGVSEYKVLFIGNLGKGRTIREIKKQINKYKLSIDCIGEISKEKLASLYKKNVLIFPSSIETDAFPILESMSCGGYIFAVNLPYAKEALEGYNNVKFFPEKDEKKLSELMKKWIEGKITKHESNVSVERQILPRSKVLIPIIYKICEKNG